MTDAVTYRSDRTDAELRTAICDWLRANNIDPALVPADEKPSCSYRPETDGTTFGGETITTRVRVRVRPGSNSVMFEHHANRPSETTINVPMKVAPPPIVQAWLDSRCPTCER